jgi:HlyD family secretion protein
MVVMKRRRALILLLMLGAAALCAAGYVYREPLAAWGRGVYAATIAPRLPGAHPFVVEQFTAPSNPLVASGTIEAHTVTVSSPHGGRLVAVHVKEGDRVKPGEAVAEVDTTLDEAQLAQAQAAAGQAKAQWALLKAGARSADLDVLRAAVEQARSAAAAAHTTAQDARALVTAPGSLDARIAGAQSAVEAAGEQVKAAQANAVAADLDEQLMARTVKLMEEGVDVGVPGGMKHFDTPAAKMEEARQQWNLAGQKQWQAHAQVDIAAAAQQSARQVLADLRAQKADPQVLQAQANAAEAAAQVADAAVTAVQAALDVALAGATPEQLQGAEARISQAEAGVGAVQARLAQARIHAPQRAGLDEGMIPWTVTTVALHTGEVASPGSPILHLADLGRVTLTAYVAEPDLGRVRLGQAVEVVVDSYRERLFPGTVTQIADEAEFTPKNVETREQRVNTVYAIKIALENPDATLKPGMPADATFCAEGTSGCAGATISDQGGGLSLPTLRSQESPTASPIQASGIVEGNDTTISSELSGRVIEVNAVEGQPVAAGQVLVRLDGAELEAQAQQANAARASAQAELARVTAAPQAARVEQAQAQVAQAEAALAAARTALTDARSQRDKPLDLDSQINNARSQLDAFAAQIDLARANLKAAQTLQASLPEGTGSDQDKTQRAVYDQQVTAEEAALRAVEAQRKGAQATLAQLRAIRAKPVALDAAVHHAEGQTAQAEAALASAKAVLAQVQAPAQPEAVAVAESGVTQADAALAVSHSTLDKLSLTSPVTGTVSAQTLHAGEVALPGAPLLTVVDLQHVKLVIYVPAGRIGQVKPGQQAQVTTDSYPGRRFSGTVTHINDEGEFTPKNVQTQEERVKMVFRVEIALDNPGGALKPGMSADAVLQE